MSWYLSPALETLRAQVNRAHPGRSKATDGTIGNEEHSARDSDHNPRRPSGEVCAWDVTHDLPELDAHALADELLRAQDPRLKYVISRGRIGSGPRGPRPGVWRDYDGPNEHDKHAHVSVHPDAHPRPWALDLPDEEDDMSYTDQDRGAEAERHTIMLKRNDEVVRRLDLVLGTLGALAATDGRLEQTLAKVLQAAGAEVDESRLARALLDELAKDAAQARA